jgi:hypothetical protein
MSNDLIDELLAAGFGLGGSRRMAQKYPTLVQIGGDTDWDLYCNDTSENRQLLLDKGFLMIEAENRLYWDDLLVDMYKHKSLPIEVLIRKDCTIYRSSFEALSGEVFVERLWKSSPTRDPNMCKASFCMSVRDYFNGIFRLHGFTPVPDDVPY